MKQSAPKCRRPLVYRRVEPIIAVDIYQGSIGDQTKKYPASMTHPAVATALACSIAYLLGSVPFGLLLGLLKGVDIRETGSGNIGATNLARAAGRRWGYLAFLLDFAKGCGPVLAVRAIGPERFLLARHGWLAVLVGLCAVLGHVFPVYLRFRGGKGVATGFGVMTALAWLSTLIAGVVWVVLFLPTRMVSVASLGAVVVLPLAVALTREGAASDSYVSVQVLTVACALLIICRHRENIARLLRGEEHSFRRKDPKEEPEEADGAP